MSPVANKLKSPKSRKKSNEDASSRQSSLLEMFARKPKRKVSDNSVSELILNEEKPDEKRARINVDDNPVLSDKENVEPKNDDKTSKEQEVQKVKSIPKASVQKIKCKECRQFLSEVSVYPGDPAGAEEEFVVLTHDSLSLFVGNEETERPQHKVTGFTVYDKGMHICSFDSGLIEKNIELYFSGVVKPVFEEDPGLEGGISGKRLGPINEWFTAGFDGGEKALVGFSTGFADYILMEPSADYQQHWAALQEKIYMSKNVIEFLSDNPAAVYEDLVNRIQTAVPPASLGVEKFTEDSLLRHAQFVVEQVESYDSARSEDEDSLLGTPCVRDLIHLAGVTLGKRRMARRNTVLKKEKHVKASSTRATTTRLVAEIMEQFFQGTMDVTTGNKIRRRRCGVCEACLKPECGKCASCRDMVKFGGNGRSKQTCVDRKCPNIGLDDGDEEQDVGEEEEPKMKASPMKSSRVKQQMKRSFKWVGDPIFEVEKEGDCQYFASVRIGDEVFTLGDCVSVLSDTDGESTYVGRIMYMWQAESKMVHIDWFVRSSETILQEAGDPAEVFLVDECEDMKVSCINQKVEVHHKVAHKDWFFMGGVDDDRQLPKYDGKTSFYYQKWYDPDIARFVDLPTVEITDEPDFCPSCARLAVVAKKNMPTASVELRQSDSKVFYKVASKDGVEYTIGDSVYLPVATFSFDSKPPKQKKQQQPKALDEIDEDEYPEYYRKGGYVKGSNELVSEPFRVARVTQIYCSKVGKKNRDVKLKVTKFYRPENTPIKNPHYFDLNLLYWSDEEATVDLSAVEGKCRVECKYDLNVSTDEYSRKGADRFYFTEWFNSKMQEFTEPPSKSRRTAIKQMIENAGETAKKFTKVTKITKVTKTENNAKKTESENEVEVEFSKLHTLDVFSGCGGLSEGFHQAGVAEPAFAVELWEPAAQAYRLNNPGTTVFTEDCNVLLDLVMSGHEKSNCGQHLPQKGDVELLCGGPPCQGFSGMNRFNSREYSRFKNSLVVSYLSYCDYYRPRFFLLENVRNFVSFKNCMVLKLALASLVKMGYQCTFGVLQAGHYGVAQTRRRAIILAAAPGEKLPLYPEPLHTFSTRGGSLSAQVGDKRYTNNIKRLNAAPYRTITVRDTMFDLPRIPNGHSKLEISYGGEALSHFQRNIRGYQDILRDHVCKDMSSLVAARMKMIPLIPGSDWRDLPNKVVKLSDGSMTKLLCYEHHDKKQGKGSTGALRGVCSCATGKACDPLDRQFNTLIPWCLPHTGNRHNNWAGLYGRLAWDGFFSTTVTNPEPMGKQGRVLHPVQDRVVSVRECARSQGFPDNYRFFGSTLDKHREVGNAVPPPMAKAIGLEIKKCLKWKAERDLKKEAADG